MRKPHLIRRIACYSCDAERVVPILEPGSCRVCGSVWYDVVTDQPLLNAVAS